MHNRTENKNLHDNIGKKITFPGCLRFRSPFHRKLVFSWILELFPGFFGCLDVDLSLMLSWFPFTADSSLAFIDGEEAIDFLKADVYCGPICIR